jgi:hypothetical protein
LGEISRGGGCVPLDRVDTSSIAAAIVSLIDQPAKLASLSEIARARSFKSWADYTRELVAWMQSLPRR